MIHIFALFSCLASMKIGIQLGCKCVSFAFFLFKFNFTLVKGRINYQLHSLNASSSYPGFFFLRCIKWPVNLKQEFFLSEFPQ